MAQRDWVEWHRDYDVSRAISLLTRRQDAGSADDDTELELLKSAARQRLLARHSRS